MEAEGAVAEAEVEEATCPEISKETIAIAQKDVQVEAGQLLLLLLLLPPLLLPQAEAEAEAEAAAVVVEVPRSTNHINN